MRTGFATNVLLTFLILTFAQTITYSKAKSTRRSRPNFTPHFTHQAPELLAYDVLDVDFYNKNAFKSVYPRWKYPDLLNSPSIRPQAAKTEYLNSSDLGNHYLAPHLFPEANEPPPEDVQLIFFPISLLALDELEESYKIDIFYKESWTDWRLQFATENISDPQQAAVLNSRCLYLNNELSAELTGQYNLGANEPGNTKPASLWSPYILSNMLDGDDPPHVISEGFKICGNGNVASWYHGVFTFKTILYRRKWPFDDHMLKFEFYNKQWTPWQVQPILPHGHEFTWVAFEDLAGWQVGDVKLEFRYRFFAIGDHQNLVDTTYMYTEEELLEFFSNFSLQDYIKLKSNVLGPYEIVLGEIYVKRDPLTFVLSVIFPMVIIVVMCGFCFLFSISQTEFRMTICITSVLSIMAFSTFLGSELPPVTYLTYAHVLLVLSYVYIMFATGLSALVSFTLIDDIVDIMECGEEHVKRISLVRYYQSQLTDLKEEADIERSESRSVALSASNNGNFFDTSLLRKDSIRMNPDLGYDRIKSIPIRRWTCDEVALFLHHEGFPKCAQNALEKDIDGVTLLELDSEGFLELGAENYCSAGKIKARLHSQKGRQAAQLRYDYGCIDMFRLNRSNEISEPVHKSNTRRSRFEKKFTLISRMILVFIDSQMVWFYPSSYVLAVILSYAIMVA